MSEELDNVLNNNPAIKSDFDTIITGLRRRLLLGPHQCAKATIEIIRSLVSKCNFKSTELMMRLVRALGKELTMAAESEFTIGNLVRRVLFIIREEHVNEVKEALQRAPKTTPKRRSSKVSDTSMKPRSDSVTSGGSVGSSDSIVTDSVAAQIQGIDLAPPSSSSSSSFEVDPAQRDSLLTHLTPGGAQSPLDDFTRYLPGLKAAVLGAINELATEIDNVTPICKRAEDYIHADECIFTYGYSKMVEQFLRAAGAKRRFQLIIAEGAPSLEGHKLAAALSKSSPPSHISITLIPDSNIYAIMSRVNKVILSPEAVMADGGSICRSGHLMVAIAAKEMSVPVVGVTGAFALTPLFAHNQTAVLGQLLRPADSLHYDFDVHFGNVQVMYPAFDYVGPELVDLFVTNDGSQLPSYVFRQLSEYYHPSDYVL